MSDIVDPFNKDVAVGGQYEYTDPSRRSSAYSNRRFSDEIVRMVPGAARRIVDVGCGDGAYTAVLGAETKAKYILGIDPAAKAIERASKCFVPTHPNLEFRACMAKDLVESGERFDVAVYRGVIHHTANPAAEIATALKLAGTVIFLEPNGWNPILKLIERLSSYHRRHGERSFRVGRFARWIRQGGGKIEHVGFFGLVPFFCPDWIVTIGATLEPVVERIPLLRIVACGQMGIVASSRARPQ